MKEKMKIGDILYRSKGAVEHAGAYFGNGKVIHNSPDGNVQTCSIEQFSDGKTIKVKMSKLSSTQEDEFLQRAKQVLTKPHTYNPVTFNCEHLVSEVLNGVRSSPQIKGTVIGGTVGTLIAASTNSKHSWCFIFAGALLGCSLVNSQRKYDHAI
jgi:hypothetical protein